MPAPSYVSFFFRCFEKAYGEERQPVARARPGGCPPCDLLVRDCRTWLRSASGRPPPAPLPGGVALLTGLCWPRRIVNTLASKIWSLLGLYRLTSARPAGMLYPQHIVTHAQTANKVRSDICLPDDKHQRSRFDTRPVVLAHRYPAWQIGRASCRERVSSPV